MRSSEATKKTRRAPKRRPGPGFLRLALLALLAGGCSTERQPGELYRPTDVGVLVVDGTLIVGKPFPLVTVRQTLTPGDSYDAAAAAVHEASVKVVEESPQFAGGYTVLYSERSDRLGRYLPGAAGQRLIQPGTRYTLEVIARDGRRATAVTVTPAPFHLSGSVLLDERSFEVTRMLRGFAELGEGVYTAPENRIVYQQGLLEARFAPNGAIAYQVGLSSLDLGSPRVISADFLGEEDYARLTRDNSSPALEAADGQVRLPWFAIFFAGRYRVTVYAVDRNWYDFVRSSPQAGGGFGFGGNAGDNFERPIFHVEGGIGLFGSAAADSVGFYIEPPPEPGPRP